MSASLIEDGCVAVDAGRIKHVCRFEAFELGSSVVEDLGDVVLLPGLVNAHTHLELSHAARGEPPASFGAWLQKIATRRGTLTLDEYAAAVAAATRDGAAECLRVGVTAVGDISRECRTTRSALQHSPLSVVSFGEVQALAQRRVLLEERLAAAIDASFASDHLTIGISPHAPYTVEPHPYERCVAAARERGLPICTHLAESLEETLFLHEQTGPLRELWETFGTWDEHVPRWPGSPVELAKATGLLDVAALLAHVNYPSDADLDTLAASNATVVWCPRTHAYFGHAPHRWREMLARGINVCVGTDSRASAPDLNVVDDLRLVRRQSPEVAVETLWEMVTTRAARGLRRSDVGAIAPGMRADLVAFPVRGDQPLREVLETAVLPSAVIIGGERHSPSPPYPGESAAVRG
jgi:cytosine/adenosine deaminase-related metal-dependent hydrolase